MTLEQLIEENKHRYPKIFTLKGHYRVSLLGESIIIDGRKTHKKASKAIGKTPVEAFQNALSIK